MVSASTKKHKSEIKKTKVDLGNPMKQSQNLLIGTKPAIVCSNEYNLNQCLEDFLKNFYIAKKY